MGKKKVVEVEVRAQVPIRMTSDEKARIEEAAKSENLPLGTWMRNLALKAAKQMRTEKR